MTEEIVFVSNDFNITGPVAQKVIDGFGYRNNDVVVGNQELIPFYDPSMDENWELITNKGTPDEKRDLLYSVIHVWQDEEHFSPTHIWIVCSKKKILIDYLTQLAILLWKKCNPYQPEISGHPPVRPYFRSLTDYLLLHGHHINNYLYK